MGEADAFHACSVRTEGEPLLRTKLEIQGRWKIRFQRFYGDARIHPFSRHTSLQTSYQSFSKMRCCSNGNRQG